ncbi:bifunctional glutathione transferase/peroxidase [Kluyveromyces lactis]|uniref:glutathione transferase n=1 Tax=Kluyveromyces lactis (strain ATCC 8585 / CBS 2359 / DSM 70799 / NBRC 1267 / NRRL Y-1140 / WM37) TaxID=284590 RepID=Q6CYH8_KLULA|nr:uncharacterized protein KLLA0_A00264g [Kluyveromyces lactis]CAH02599.1 KLLA0A00264p [Kluyveromyces lactis]|eukprot:XP_451011.1 uncharacterized protein KLLA0_A00264g [Kluyveromyces lactis]
MSTNVIKVHWLNQSRAFRVLWLLDHLKLDYEIVPYKRNEQFRAPEELKKIHPLGRAPILEIDYKSSDRKDILAESGYIFQYILENFDKEGILNNADQQKAEKIKYYLHYAEGSLQPPLFIEFLLSKAKEAPVPFPFSYITKKFADKISEKYSRGEVKNQLDFIETEIEQNDGYLVGGKLSAADILLSFPLEMAFERQFARTEEYPNIAKWLETIKREESYSTSKDKAKANGASF